MNADRRRPTRRGHSLIELIVVMGGVVILLGLCAGLIHTLLRLDRGGRDSVHDTATLAGLSRRFRQDVRAARDAKPGEPGSLELTRPGGHPVSYRTRGARLVREERDGAAVVRREAYAVARLGPVRFETDGGLVRLIAERRPADPRAPARAAVRVEAKLDKDRTLTEPEEARK